MKLILLKDIDNLGKMGDEVNVKDGYARNYLIPKKFGAEATEGTLRVLEKKKKEKAFKDNKIKEEIEQLSEKIAAASYTIPVDAGEGDKLFGSVTSDIIAETMRSEGVEVDKKKIVLENPIKELGVYNIQIRLHPEVETQARIWVVKK